MKQIVSTYTFNPGAGTVTFTEFDTISLGRIMLVVNATRGVVLFATADSTRSGTVSGNVLTLAVSTSGHSSTDDLAIHYMPRPGDPTYDRLVVGNAGLTKFRDSLSYASGADPAVWDVVNTGAAGEHVITHGGNSSGSSYLRISLSPFTSGATEVTITSKAVFDLPVRAQLGLSMSQRLFGQEVFAGLVGATGDTGATALNSTVADVAISGSTMTIAASVATVTHANHGLVGGDRIVIYGATALACNVGPVLVTVVDKNTFTVANGNANGTYSATGAMLHIADPLRYVANGLGFLFDAVVPTAGFLVSRRAGDKFRQIAATTASTAATQTSTNPYSDAMNATGTFELTAGLDEVAFRSQAADGIAGPLGLLKLTQALPEPYVGYRLQLRARVLPGQNRPVGRILTATKTGTTTATITTDVAHGLATGDYVVIFGIRDQANFPNVTASTAVTVTSSTVFTIPIAGAVTASSVDGVVGKQFNTQIASTAYFTASIISMTRSNGVLALTSNATWATPLPGEYVHVYGLEPGSVALEGAYKVLRVVTSVLELDAPGSDFAIVNTGGAVIRRTDVRLHYARVLDSARLSTEITGGRGNVTDINNSVPVTIAGATTLSSTVIQSTGSVTAGWNAAGFGGFLVADIVSAALTTTTTIAAVTPGFAASANVGTYAHSWSIAVTAVTGSTPTLDVQVQESVDNGTTWVAIYDFQRITAVGVYQSPLIRAQWGTRYRYVQTVAGTTPSFTRSMNRIQFSSNAPLVRQMVDRTVVLTTLNSTTAVLNCDGVDTAQLTVLIGAATTPPALQMEGSEDASSWYSLGAALTAVASSTTVLVVPNIMPKFIRARVSTAGVSVTAGYVGIKAVGR